MQVDSFFKSLEKLGVPREWFIGIGALVLLGVVAVNIPGALTSIIVWAARFSPLWLPLLLAVVFWQVRMHYVRAQFIAKQETTVLEVRIPRDIEKSPRAMELAFIGMHVGIGESTPLQRWWKGQVRPWFSFELVSNEGQVHFYIWTRKFLQPVVEQQIYAQYPEVEIYEVPDYTRGVSYDPQTMSVWGCDFKLGSEDVLPIKSYIDYELDKDPREEYRIDPFAHLLEYLSGLGPGERVWIQILARTNKDKRWKKGTLLGLEDRWKNEVKEKIEEIRAESVSSYKNPVTGEEAGGFPNQTPGQTKQIEVIERHVGKQAFDVGIRGVYIAAKDSFNGVRNVGLTGVFRQFSSSRLNSLDPTGWFVEMSYPWQETERKKRRTSRELIDAYKRRSWFHPPYLTPHYVMSAESLATIYHFPSRGVEAPGLIRIPSTKAEPPPNLPFS